MKIVININTAIYMGGLEVHHNSEFSSNPLTKIEKVRQNKLRTKINHRLVKDLQL